MPTRSRLLAHDNRLYLWIPCRRAIYVLPTVSPRLDVDVDVNVGEGTYLQRRSINLQRRFKLSYKLPHGPLSRLERLQLIRILFVPQQDDICT